MIDGSPKRAADRGTIAALRNLPAPAKLNLFLHVTGRRADGYHLLQTVFEFVDFSDRVHLTRRDDGRIVRHDPLPGVPDEEDLAVRAARLLASETGTGYGVEIAIDKRIPLGGGLGGGSSDAATVLLGLNRLWQLGIPRARMQKLALRLGADVPVFVFGRRAFAAGIGERLQSLPGAAGWHVIVAPAVNVPTAAVFGSPELTRHTKVLRISGLSRGRSVYRGKNDLEPVVCAAWPPVAEALEALRRAADGAGVDGRLARMTGSGACVFCPVPDESVAASVRQRLDALALGTVITARALDRHPLSDWSFSGGRDPKGVRPGSHAVARSPQLPADRPLGSSQVG